MTSTGGAPSNSHCFGVEVQVKRPESKSLLNVAGGIEPVKVLIRRGEDSVK